MRAPAPVSVMAALAPVALLAGCAAPTADIETAHARPAASCLVDPPFHAPDAEVDRWLKEASPTYAAAAAGIESDPGYRGYRFATRADVPRGMTAWVDGWLEIQLNPGLSGPDRVTTLIFEVANAARFPDHQQVDMAVDRGLMATPEEFGLANEIIEYEALKTHRQILVEIASRVGDLPAAFFCYVTPAARTVEDYRLPGLYHYLKAQKESGHTDHYYRCFRRRRPAAARPGGTP